MASVNQTRPHCVNQMGKTHSKPLAARHGRGKAWAWHGHGMLCVNRPLLFPFVLHVSTAPLLIALITCYEEHNLRSSLYRIQAKDGTAVESELTCCSAVRYIALSHHPEHHWNHTRLHFKRVPGNLCPSVQRPGCDAENLTSRLGMHGVTEILHTSSYSVPISAQGFLHDY